MTPVPFTPEQMLAAAESGDSDKTTSAMLRQAAAQARELAALRSEGGETPPASAPSIPADREKLSKVRGYLVRELERYAQIKQLTEQGKACQLDAIAMLRVFDDIVGPLEPLAPPVTAAPPTLRERAMRFNDTTGSLRGGNVHPDRCVCQEQETGQFADTPHKHYRDPPHSCARCGADKCSAYYPAVPQLGAESVTAPETPRPAQPRAEKDRNDGCAKCGYTAGEHCDLDEPGLDHTAECGLMHHEFKPKARPAERREESPIVGEFAATLSSAICRGCGTPGDYYFLLDARGINYPWHLDCAKKALASVHDRAAQDRAAVRAYLRQRIDHYDNEASGAESTGAVEVERACDERVRVLTAELAALEAAR